MSLNSKKSWDPNRKSNRTKLESLESDAIRQEKLRRARIEAEREHEQLQQLANDAQGGSEISRNRSWMYTSKPDSIFDISKESSEILLGTRSRSRYSEAEKAEQKSIRQQNRKLTADPLEMLNEEEVTVNGKVTSNKRYHDNSKINKNTNRPRNASYTDSRTDKRTDLRFSARADSRTGSRTGFRSDSRSDSR